MTPAAAQPPSTVLPPASARRLQSISSLLGQAGLLYEDLLAQLAEHDAVIAVLVARVHPEEGEPDAGQ